MSSLAIFVIVVIVTLLLGVPVSVSFCLSGIAFVLIEGIPTSIVIQNMVNNVDSMALMCVPLFILAGDLMSYGGIAKRLVRLANLVIGDVTGGLAYVTLVVCMFFASLTGSAMACSVAIGSIMMPYMLKAGYDREFAAAIVAAGAILGPIIPPSTAMIVFGRTANVSIVQLYKVGVPAGIFLAILIGIVAFIICKKRGYKGMGKTLGLSDLKGLESIKDGSKLTVKQVLLVLVDALPAIVAPFIILGSLFTGICTPTESAVIAVVYSFFIGVFVYREIKISKITKVIRATCKNTSTVLYIMGCAGLFAWVLSYSRAPDMVVENLVPLANSMGGWAVMLFIVVILLIMGCFMNASAIMLITIPMFFKMVTVELGYHPIHFGIIMTVACCIGFITPPFGNVLFTTMTVADVKLHRLAKALIPFLILYIVGLLFITFIPQLTLFVL